MILDLKQLFSSAVTKQEFSLAFSLAELELNGSYPFVTPICVLGTVTNRAGIVTCAYTVRYMMELTCDRCLQLLNRECEQEFSHILVTELENEEEDGEAFLLVEDQKLDVEQLVRDDILLNLPAKMLCKPDCKGLCPECGANLNEGDCGCEKKQVDPRLAALAQLLED